MFEFGSDVMDEEQRANLELFARYLGKFDTGAVVINGHADKAGTNPYNQSLSRARSIAVWRELIKAGVSPDRIAISAYGETHPVIDTPDGMREPLNRRAEVELRLPPLYATITEVSTSGSVPCPWCGKWAGVLISLTSYFCALGGVVFIQAIFEKSEESLIPLYLFFGLTILISSMFLFIEAPGAGVLSFALAIFCTAMALSMAWVLYAVDPYRKSGELPPHLGCHAFIFYRADAAQI